MTHTSSPAPFPLSRPRRLRSTPWIRRLCAENSLTPNDLIHPIFVCEGHNQQQPVPSMPNVARVSLDILPNVLKHTASLSIPAVALFPHTSPEKRDEKGSEALNPDNLVCRAVKIAKDARPDLGVICDAALDPFTSHGHDGIIDQYGNVLNDDTVKILVEQSLIQARAGCDVIAPSDMMDGRIRSIRNALENNSLQNVAIMSYAAKYASSFYGPFRHAVGSAKALQGDKKTYQMNPANSKEAIAEIIADVQEGADMIIVKPGGNYLDIVRQAADAALAPIFPYQVSGEYSLISFAAQNNALQLEDAVMESLIAFKRAGAAAVLSYFAPLAAEILNR